MQPCPEPTAFIRMADLMTGIQFVVSEERVRCGQARVIFAKWHWWRQHDTTIPLVEI